MGEHDFPKDITEQNRMWKGAGGQYGVGLHPSAQALAPCRVWVEGRGTRKSGS